MSEQLDTSMSPENESVHDPIEQIVAIERTLNYLRDEGAVLFQTSYPSEDEANAATLAIEAMFETKIDAHINIAKIPLRVSGEGVYEVALCSNPSLEDILALDHENPYTLTDPNDSCDFYFDSWNHFIEEVSPDDWRIKICLYGEKFEMPMNRATTKGEPFLKHSSKPMIRINCNEGSAFIESVGLAERRDHKRVLAELSALTNSNEQQVVAGLLQDLTYVVEATNPDSLVAVDDIRMLHAFGTIGAQYAREDIRKADALATAVASFLGKDRSILLDGAGYVMGQDAPLSKEAIVGLYGKLETIATDVPMSVSIEGQPVGPTFIISDAGTMYALPFIDLAKMAI